jgi:hypothetical protein
MRGICGSVVDLKAAINRFVTDNAYPKPFVCTADPRRVLAGFKREKQALVGPPDVLLRYLMAAT